MLCLGIESSCDETALALVQDGKLLSSVLASQADMHALFGGVVPELAGREHYRYIGPLFDKLLAQAAIKTAEIDLIAIARGPGLLGSLLVGMAFAKGLALGLGCPLLGINHLHAHLLACGLEHKLKFPALGLLVSGGHTNLYLIESPASFKELSRTIDDAAGEALDKTGQILGLAYPAGHAMDELAQVGLPGDIRLPRPMAGDKNFSFSGLKTAAAKCAQTLGLLNKHIDSEIDRQKLADFCAALNLAIVDTLTQKLQKALTENPQVKGVWLAGGVAANSLLRTKTAEIAKAAHLPFLVPQRALCTDNAAMIAWAAYLLGKEGCFHPLSLAAVPRGRKMPEDMERQNPNC